MSAPGIPREVERFIAQRIDSVALLEALLLVRAARDRAWTRDDVARALVTRAEHAGALLDQLVGEELVAYDGATYRYAPGQLAADVDALAECHATRRPTVIGLILTPRRSDAEAPTDAFRLRQKP